MDPEVEEKEPVIKERLILDDYSDGPRGVFSEKFKKSRKNRSGVIKAENAENNNSYEELSNYEFDPATSKLIHSIESSDTLEGIALKYNTTIAALMKENKLWTRAALHGRKTLTISVTRDALMAHIKSKQEQQEQKQQQREEITWTFCADMECDEDMARFYLQQNQWDYARAREKLRYDVAMAYKQSQTSYQPDSDDGIDYNSSTDDSQNLVDSRQIVAAAKERPLFFASPEEREKQVHPVNKKEMKRLENQVSDIFQL